jgi:hypothetical protein
MNISIVCVLAALLAGCGSSLPTSDETQARQQEQAAQEANAQTGFPGITAFTEKKMVKLLYERRDKAIATFSYAMALDGRLFHICDSIGYGLPYGVQFTNPDKVVNNTSQSFGTLPQPEPNGLFMPPTAEGTWVMCAGPKGEIDPLYVEPRVVVSTHKLRASGDWEVAQ